MDNLGLDSGARNRWAPEGKPWVNNDGLFVLQRVKFFRKALVRKVDLLEEAVHDLLEHGLLAGDFQSYAGVVPDDAASVCF